MTFSLQTPICIVGPGPQPTSDMAKSTTLSSGHEVMLFPADMRNTAREDLPIVVAWNGEVHYTATVPMDHHELNLWRVRCMVHVATFCKGIAEQVDVDELQDSGKQAVTHLLDGINAAVAQFQVDDAAAYLTVEAAKEPSGIFPEGSTAEGLTDAPEQPQKQMKGRKDIHCDQCELIFSRRDNYQSHVASAHTDGAELKCTISPCFKQLKSFKALTLHYKLQHDKDHKFVCSLDDAKGKPCKFRTHSQQNFDVHLVDKHGKGTKVECRDCHKWFAGEANLARHKKFWCPTKKTKQCLHCPMAYTTDSKLHSHMREHHSEELLFSATNELLQQQDQGESQSSDHNAGKESDKDSETEITLRGDAEKEQETAKRMVRICSICDSQYDSKTEYDSHMDFHRRKKETPKPTLEDVLGNKKKDKEEKRDAAEKKEEDQKKGKEGKKSTDKEYTNKKERKEKEDKGKKGKKRENEEEDKEEEEETKKKKKDRTRRKWKAYDSKMDTEEAEEQQRKSEHAMKDMEEQERDRKKREDRKRKSEEEDERLKKEDAKKKRGKKGK